MAYFKTYQGEFLSRDAVIYRVEIWTEADTAPDSVGELSFPAESPLTIEWLETSKESPICSSTAVLTLISPEDRTYTGLYSIKAPGGRLDVYRNGSLYWSGTLDPEFYEEPYQSASGYDVQLTFSDFGILDRIKFATTGGSLSISDIITEVLDAAGIKTNGVDTSMISTETDSDPLDLSRLSVMSANFYDEDGEASTMKDVLTDCLQPFALKIQQRAGRIWIYDLNGLYHAGATGEIYWTGDEQTLSADKVANDVRVAFSPYVTKGAMNISAEYSGKTKAEPVSHRLSLTADGNKVLTVKSSFGNDFTTLIDSFNLYVGEGKGAAEVNAPASYFKIVPIQGGASADEGIIYGAHVKRDMQSNDDEIVGHLLSEKENGCPVIGGYYRNTPRKVFTTKRVYIPPSEDGSALLCLKMDALVSMRNNPWGDDTYNCKEEEDAATTQIAWMFLPVSVCLYASPDSETPFLKYSNEYVTTHRLGYWRNHIPNYGSADWYNTDQAPRFGDSWLAYYDGSDLKEKSKVGKWMTNHHNVGRNDLRTAFVCAQYGEPLESDGMEGEGFYERRFTELPDGEFIRYPRCGGWLEITVWAGVAAFDYDNRPLQTIFSGDWGDLSFGQKHFDIRPCASDHYKNVRWILYKLPSVDIVNNDLAKSELEQTDIEYTGVINPLAKEHLSISTTVGTSETPVPGARGIVFYRIGEDSAPLGKCTRAGHTDQPENLLIGTIVSQFADRHIKLTGEAAILTGRVSTLTERCQDGLYFLPVSESQDLVAGTAELIAVELSPEEYEAIKRIPEK